MRSCLRLLVVALVAVTPLVAQEPTPGPGTSPPADRPTVPAPSATRPSSTDLGDFAGLWDTSYGRLRLVQEGKRVSGSYSFASGSAVEGTVAGRRLTFKYKEPTAEGEGWFELAEDGRSFRGRWREKGKETWGDWRGGRIRPVPNRVWLVVIEANWENHLAENDYSFGHMLKSFFTRVPDVQVRQRFFTDSASLKKWCDEVCFLAEPVVVSISAHGGPGSVMAAGKPIDARTVLESLQFANLRLLHFSACDVLKGDKLEKLVAELGYRPRFPISGYTQSVDWGASAALEFLYFDLILARGIRPDRAADQVRALMPYAGDKAVPGTPVGYAGLRMLMPSTSPRSTLAAPPTQP
ncbi:MAG TPA: hypothetical protein PKD86_01395 [Gemmatales bacterium]|nr:hypothetical protein [Gemmatales bacterium]